MVGVRRVGVPFDIKPAAADRALPAELRLALVVGGDGAEIRRGIRQADGCAAGFGEVQSGRLHRGGIMFRDETNPLRRAGGGRAELAEERVAVGEFGLQFRAQRGDAQMTGARSGGVRAQIIQPDDLLPLFGGQRISGGDETLAHGNLFEMVFVPEIEFVMLHKRCFRHGTGENDRAGSRFSHKTRFSGNKPKKTRHGVEQLWFKI